MISLKNVSKAYGKERVIQNLTLEIPKGQIFGLLGPNGSGKTTLLRMLTGLLRPSSGAIHLFGSHLPGAVEIRHKIGYMPQEMAVYPELTVEQNIKFFGQIYGVKGQDLEMETKKVIALTELTNKKDQLVKNLSGGMAHRVLLASALIHRPELLILDEPTAGVDPSLRLKFWDWFRDLAQGGTSILITTHHISEAVRCENVVFLTHGEILEQGNPIELITKYSATDLEEAFVKATEKTEEKITEETP